MKARIIAATLWAIAAGTSTHAAIATESYMGSAYDLETGVLLYREQYNQFETSAGAQTVVLYLCADGRAFARKNLHEEGDAQAPDFDLFDARLNYREGVRRSTAGREVYVQRSANMPERVASLSVPPNGVIDAGFNEFVLQHWDTLVGGSSLSVPFLVPSKRAFYPFKVEKVENAASPDTFTVRLSLAAWYSILVPRIDVVYDRASRRLRRYEGMSNMRDASGKNYKVRVEFPTAASTPPSPEQIQQALTAPLTESCAVVRADTSVPGIGH
jgi:hypothetical protein